MGNEYIDLYELQLLLRDGVDELFPEKLWVRAEIASIQVKANGHCYLDLTQSDGGRVVAKVHAVIWRSNYIPLGLYFKEAAGDELKAGIEVLARVQVSYNEVYGLTLTIDEIEPRFTLGAVELARRRTIEKLEADGVTGRQKELQPALLPYNLAVISAKDAAGFGDFRKHLSGNEYGFMFNVELFEAAMQGADAPESITDALNRIECSKTAYDAVLIMRGGGSALDLSCFDDYGMCFAIANFPLPVYTAIGHDKDYHVADMVAHDFVKTPTALADLFIDAFAAEDERISSFSTRLRLAFSSRISSLESALEVLASRIRNADPRNVLSRGYTLATDSRGLVLKSAGNLRSGDKIRLMFEDGTVNATVD